MSLLSAIFPTAYAAAATTTTTAATPQQSMWPTIFMVVIFFAIFYFLLIRPQSKRAKAHRELLASIQVGEEVMTTAGIIGKINAMDENIISLEIAKNVIIKIQKQAITSTLPKGTLKDTTE